MQSFTVDPAAVHKLSAAFLSASRGADDDAAAFGSTARLPASAFGRLPESVAASSHYERKLGEALRGLASLRATLEQVSVNLTLTADSYTAADQANLLG